ncbi:radical SAM superfamily protein, partial [Vibrio parahaemolyticus V-223/04]
QKRKRTVVVRLVYSRAYVTS